jgi:hypothetical protein
MIIVYSTNKKGRPAINKAEKKTRETAAIKKANNPGNHQEKCIILKNTYHRIRDNVQDSISHIREAQKKLDELYEILKNISSLKKNKTAGEIYKTIQSIHKKSEQLDVKHLKMDIKIQLVEEITEDLQKTVNLTNDLIISEIKQESGEVEEKLEEITERIDVIYLKSLKIQNEKNPNEETRIKIRDLEMKKVKAKRKKKAKNENKKEGNYTSKDITNAQRIAINTVRKLIPLCETFKIVLPETLIKIEETDKKQYRENIKAILELILENIEEIRKKIGEEMNSNNLTEVQLKELLKREREIRVLDDRIRKHYFRLKNNAPIHKKIKKNKFYTPSRTKIFQRFRKVRSYQLCSTKLFKNLEEACETLQKNLSSKSKKYKEIQEIKKNIENKKLIAYDKIKKRQKKFRDKFPYFEEVRKIIGDIVGEIQELAEKQDKKEEIKLEVARKLMLEMDKFYFKIIMLTNEIDGRPLDTEIEKKLEEIDPGFKDRKEEIDEEKSDMISELEDLEEDIFLEENYEELSLKSQVSNDYIDELSYNPIAKLKTHIDHDPMEQEEQSITIKAIGNEIRSKRDIGLEIDFSEASKSSDENSDEDLYDRGPYKKVKKKNYVESNYIEEDEL